MDIISTPSQQLELPTNEEAASALDRARLKAAIGFEVMVELITMRGFEPNISTKGALDIGEYLYKVSGMAQKQAPPAIMPTVRFNFNSIRSSGIDMDIEIDSVQNNPDAIFETTDNTLTRPSYMDKYPIFGNALDVDFTDLTEE